VFLGCFSELLFKVGKERGERKLFYRFYGICRITGKVGERRQGSPLTKILSNSELKYLSHAYMIISTKIAKLAHDCYFKPNPFRR